MIGIAKISSERKRTDLWLFPSLLVLAPLGMGLFGHVKALGQSNRYAAHLFPLFIIIAAGGIFSATKLCRGSGALTLKWRRTLYVTSAAFAAVYLLLALSRQYLFATIHKLAPHTGLTHLGQSDLEAYFAQINLFLGFTLLSFILPVLLSSLSRVTERYRKATLFLSYGLVASCLLWAARNDFTYASYYAYNVKNVNDLHVATGKWLNENIPKDAVIAVNDIGGIGYFARREVIDLIGMATPEVVPYRSRGELGLLDYFDKVKRPDYLIIYPEWFPLIDSMTERFRRIREFKIADNTVCVHDRHFVYRVNRGERMPSLPGD